MDSHQWTFGAIPRSRRHTAATITIDASSACASPFASSSARFPFHSPRLFGIHAPNPKCSPISPDSAIAALSLFDGEAIEVVLSLQTHPPPPGTWLGSAALEVRRQLLAAGPR